MKKVYSTRAGTEVFALAPEQLAIFEKSGYNTPSVEAVIADAGAAVVTPPEGKRAYVAFNFQKGEFAVRVRGCTLHGSDAPVFVGEVVQAAVTKRLLEAADPDRPKEAAPSAPKLELNPLMSSLLGGLLNKATEGAGQAPPDAPEEAGI